MIIDVSNTDRQDASHLITDMVVPRPIAWVSTISKNGFYNLAPFSGYTMITARPMMLGIFISTNRYGRKKDTQHNIENTREFVINAVTEELTEAMNLTAPPYPPEVSEFDKAGITAIRANMVSAPLVAESPLNIECRLHRIIKFGNTPELVNFIIGEVLLIHIKDEFYDVGKRRITGLRPIARLGGDQDLYCRTADIFQLARPELK